MSNIVWPIGWGCFVICVALLVYAPIGIATVIAIIGGVVSAAAAIASKWGSN